MPPRGTRAQRKAGTREALLNAAARLFARDGFAGARVEEIAALAGVTTGALYSHFAGKEALFLAVYEEFAARRVRDVEASTSAGSSPRARGRAGADQWMALFDADPWRLRLHLEFAEFASRDARLRRDFAERAGAVRGAIARVLGRESEASGRALPMDAESLAAVVRALGIGLAAERLVDPGAIPAGLFGDFVELLFAMLFEDDGDR